ncbi:glycosyltransferase family 10 domain-containing protein [Mucilaginibacter lappiensis]|uniref:Glycosyltransferase family 10 (Fucosyltransferase) C-term n=1 Tax=Mucilaginibacter lappiensis TaxID=354630 RepID=A0A841JN17_9SPHI|nr:glycosyltransferase family 10 [Mucilaginibacter lappiensis]MBB6131824.1 hypothetical protein [Mucilaginibacter lappiensis]
MIEANNDLSPICENKKKIKLLFYNRFWNYEYPKDLALVYPEVDFFFHEDCIHEVEVVVFHIPSLNLLPDELRSLKKRREQIWVYWSLECEVHYLDFQKPEIRNLFDFTATYKCDADIPLPYISGCKDIDWRRKPAKKTGFVNAFFSSKWDKSGRYNYLKEIMSRLNIDSFGEISNNQSRQNDPYLNNGLDFNSLRFKEEVISRYKFTLSFENAIATDYVTEKFFQPLIYGSIPIYLGAPNVDAFAPGDKCFINVNSFSSVNELAEYLILLDNRDDLYNEYFKWKTLPFRASFESKINLSKYMLVQLITLVKKKANL